VSTVGFASPASLQDEASGTVQIAVVLSAAAERFITVEYSLTGGTATNGVDYTGSDGTLSFAPGETGQAISLVILADGIEEPPETIEIRLRSPSAGGELGASSHTLTISADILPRVAFTAGTSSAAESATTTIEIALDVPATVAASVDYTITGTATGGGTDFTLTSGTVTFAPGATTQQLVVGEVNDALDEDDESIVVTLTNPTNVIIGASGTRTHTIADNDLPPTVTYTTTSSSSSEATATFSLNVTLSAPSGRTVTVPFSRTGGTANAPADYSYATSSALMFPAGTTAQTITVSVVDDNLDEDSETVDTTLGTPTNGTLTGSPTRTLTITDNDPRPTASFNIATSSRTEGNVTTTLTVALSTASGRTVTVPFSATGGTAISPDDYSYGTSSPLTFAAGTTSRTIDVDLVEDVLIEGPETLDTTLGTPTNADLGAIITRTLTITDND